MSFQHWLGAVAIALTFLAFAPYIRSIRSGVTKPHVFSWIVWAAVTLIVFFAQLADGAGVGAWPIGLSGTITLYVAWLAWMRRSDIVITRTDGFFMALALSALPLWAITQNPLWAVVVLTLADMLGFVPTFRKAFADPHAENVSFYAIIVLRNAAAIAALEHFSLTTLLFPATIAWFSALLVAMVLIRRRRLLPV